jgi:hypothetical protein
MPETTPASWVASGGSGYGGTKADRIPPCDSKAEIGPAVSQRLALLAVSQMTKPRFERTAYGEYRLA